MKKRMLALLLAMLMVLGMLPAQAFALEADLGQARVIVENTTYTSSDAAWSGTLIDKLVDIESDSSMMSLVADAITSSGYTAEGVDSGYISSINGLSEFDGGGMSGWMGTLNDWFINEGFADFTVANGKIADGDVLRVMYSCDWGADLGGSFITMSDTTLSALSLSVGTLDFASDKTDYTVTLPGGTKNVKVNATASNKQNQVYLFVGSTEYRRTAAVPVTDGTVLTVRCGSASSGTAYNITFNVEKSYDITLPTDEAYTVKPVSGSVSPVNKGGSYSFTVEVNEKYDGSAMVVKANGTKLSAVDGVYTIKNITADQTIAVEGVVKKAEPYILYESPSDKYVSKIALDGAKVIRMKQTGNLQYTVYLDKETAKNADIDIQVTVGSYADEIRKLTGNGITKLENGRSTVTVYAERSSNYKKTFIYDLVVGDGVTEYNPTYNVTLPTVAGCTVKAVNSYLPVDKGEDYRFSVTLDVYHEKGEDFAVKANGKVLTEVEGVYTIENVTADQVVTVEGVNEKENVFTIIAPKGSTVSAGRFHTYYKYDYREVKRVEELEDDKIAVTIDLSAGNVNFYRVQHPDGVTYWNFADCKMGNQFEVTEADLHINDDTFTSDSVYRFTKNVYDLADIFVNANEEGCISIAEDATYELNVFRNWMAIENGVSNAKVALPDMHYSVIDLNGNASDVVTVTPDSNNSSVATVTPNHSGTAVILVTYDAMTHMQGRDNLTQFSAIWPESTGVIVVQVGEDGSSIETNMLMNVGENTTSVDKLAGDKLDAEHDIIFYTGNSGASYSFKPEDGCTVKVARSTVGRSMTFTGLTDSGVSVAEDGTVTVSGLTTGRHIIQVTKDGKSAYQVITTRKVSYTLLDSEGKELSADYVPKPGDKITIQYSGLVMPAEKQSGVYNFNAMLCYYGEDGTRFPATKGGGFGSYTFSGSSAAQKITITIPEDWTGETYTLSGGAIQLGGYGSPVGAHRSTTYANGKPVSFNAKSVKSVLSRLPDITIGYSADQRAADAVIDLIDAIGEVTLDSGDDIKAAREAFDELTEAQKALVTNKSDLEAAEQKLEKLKYENTKNPIKLYVTISDKGNVVMVQEELTVTDTNDNGRFDVDDALVAAHEAGYTGGAASGYASSDGSFGLSIDKLWGDESGLFGYWLNDAMCSSLEDEVKNGDYLAAFVYMKSDYSDKYAKFDSREYTSEGELTVTLTQAGFDMTTYSVVFTELSTADITVRKLDSKTRAAVDYTVKNNGDGTYTIIFTESGEYVIIASESDLPIVPAVSRAKVTVKKSDTDFDKIYKTTGDYIESKGTPSVGAIGGEWMVIGLERSGRETPNSDDYFAKVVEHVKSSINDKEQLHKSKSTENSRLILALTAMGYDVTDVDGHDLLKGLTDLSYLNKQGINGPIWALIAFDSHDYDIPDGNVTRELLINEILNAQLGDNGWTVTGDAADADMTAMAIQALAPYYGTDSNVKEAVDKALKKLSDMQLADGSFGSVDGACAESCAQVVTALTALGIDPTTDARFVKNGKSVLDALCSFYITDGGFAHLAGGELNGMATEQGYYAMASYFRLKNGLTSLYDMTDVTIAKDDGESSKPDDGEASNPSDGESSKPDDGEVSKPNDGESSKPNGGETSKPNGNNPTTGDDNNTALYAVIFITAVFAAGVMLVIDRKHRNDGRHAR